jgi:hypothetical protein
VGTSVSASERDWSSYQLTSNDPDNLMLAVMMPTELANWTRSLLLRTVDTDVISISSLRGPPKHEKEFMRGMQASVEALKDFFERWIMIGHFVTEFDCLEPVIYAHRPAGEDILDFLRPALFASNHACSAFLGNFGFIYERTIMELANTTVEDLVTLYPDPDPEDAEEYLRRLLLDGAPINMEKAAEQTKWLPGFGELPPIPEDD